MYEGCVELVVVFFFQAEDGIRDYKVTGVQTCALPILGATMLHDARQNIAVFRSTEYNVRTRKSTRSMFGPRHKPSCKKTNRLSGGSNEIGRASCRERV